MTHLTEEQLDLKESAPPKCVRTVHFDAFQVNFCHLPWPSWWDCAGCLQKHVTAAWQEILRVEYNEWGPSVSFRGLGMQCLGLRNQHLRPAKSFFVIPKIFALLRWVVPDKTNTWTRKSIFLPVLMHISLSPGPLGSFLHANVSPEHLTPLQEFLRCQTPVSSRKLQHVYLCFN